jgi:Zn-dependent protease/CBS domain-containing protein
MARHNIPLGRILGITIGLDYSWFLIFALLTWTLASGYFPAEFKGWAPVLYWFVGATTAITFFACVLLHELGHSVVALKYKVPVRSITLFVFGGVAQIAAEPPSAKAEFLIAGAGPLVSLILAVLFYSVQQLAPGIEPLLGLAKYLAYINLALALFNLIPGYPLDGGRVFRAIVWAITGDMRRATLIAAGAGRLIAFLFVFAGVWQMFGGNFIGGLWIAFIGWFLENAASAQVQQIMAQGLLRGHTVSQAMSAHCASIPEDLPLQNLLNEHILGSGQHCFLVKHGENAVGFVTLEHIRKIPHPEWATVRAGQVMLPLEQLDTVEAGTELWTALQKLDRNGVSQLPVTRDRHVVGMLSREDVISFLRTLRELGTQAA